MSEQYFYFLKHYRIKLSSKILNYSGISFWKYEFPCLIAYLPVSLQAARIIPCFLLLLLYWKSFGRNCCVHAQHFVLFHKISLFSFRILPFLLFWLRTVEDVIRMKMKRRSVNFLMFRFLANMLMPLFKIFHFRSLTGLLLFGDRFFQMELLGFLPQSKQSRKLL